MRSPPVSPRLTSDQKRLLREAVVAGTPWSTVRTSFPGIPAVYLDSHWFDWARRAAGLPAAPLPALLPELESPPAPVESPQPKAIAPKVTKKSK